MITINWAGAGDIVEMAQEYDWAATRYNSNEMALCLAGDSSARLSRLITWLKQGWTPILRVGAHPDGSLSGHSAHWVAVIGITTINGATSVTIYNPGCDCTKTYDWDTFYGYLNNGIDEDPENDKDAFTFSNNIALIRPSRLYPSLMPIPQAPSFGIIEAY